MNTIPAREVKRRGMAAADEALQDGPVYIIRNDDPAYVVLLPAQYEELLEAQADAYRTRLKAALADLEAGRVIRSSADALIAEFGLDS